MASDTNLALSASSLLSKYLNQFFVVTRVVRDGARGWVEVPAEYGELGMLLIAVSLITVLVPLGVIALVQSSHLRTRQ
jgi:hypothetical protein